MVKFIRYAIAVICFAASVGCLALWWSEATLQTGYTSAKWYVLIDVNQRTVWCDTGDDLWDVIWCEADMPTPQRSGSWILNYEPSLTPINQSLRKEELFGFDGWAYFFPVWYPALVFALAGVGALRFRRQFSIRSAFISMGVVAVLLGMVAAL